MKEKGENVLRCQGWKEEGWLSKVNPVVSEAIASSWCITTYRDSGTKMLQDKRILKK